MYSKEIINNILELYPSVTGFELGYYKYIPNVVDSPRKSIAVPRDILEKKIAQLDKYKNDDMAIGINSVVNRRGKKYHIPQIDFHVKYSEKNKKLIIESLRELGYKKGLLVCSGKSFHYYGAEILNERQWLGFLGKILRLNFYSKHKKFILVDFRWVGAALIQGYSTLRISDSTSKPYLPEIISFM